MLTKSPILFLIFNRPDTTKLVFDQIKQARPQKLYIAADGPRKNILEEEHLCNKTREIIHLIDWKCEVKTLFRESNLGCKYAVSSAINWFFEKESEGIILEDDCLPNHDFFLFCDLMLDRYREDARIRHITGCNLHNGKKWGSSSYYFSNNTHVWGWATWKRVWKDYDPELSVYNVDEVEYELQKIFNEQLVVESWVEIFKRLKQKDIDTWDYQLTLINYFNNGLSVIPNVNLISNIGFRSDGTHTQNPQDRFSNVPLTPLPEEFTHPRYVLADKSADMSTLYHDFDIVRRKRRKRKLKNQIRRFLGI